MFNIGDKVGFMWYSGPETGTIVDYNPLRKVWIVENDLCIGQNDNPEQYIDLKEDEIMEMVA